MATTKATVKEIARLAGVSIGTVDRVLHDRGGVSAETKGRIVSIIASLGFRPNILARQLSTGKTYVFHAILPRADQDSGYWASCRDGIERAARNIASYGARIVVNEFDRYDRGAYGKLLDPRSTTKADGLLIAPVMPDLLLSALERLGGSIPYAFFDGFVPGASPLFSIKQDAYAGGQAAARMLSLFARGSGPLAVIDPHPEDRHIALRVEGFGSYFSATDRRVLVRAESRFDDSEGCSACLDALFGEEPDLSGILVASASGHRAADWLGARGRRESCGLVTWDLVPANAAALRAGTIDCVISQRPFEQARDGMERLFRAVVQGVEDGVPIRAPIDAPIEIYVKENLPPSGEENGD